MMTKVIIVNLTLYIPVHFCSIKIPWRFGYYDETFKAGLAVALPFIARCHTDLHIFLHTYVWSCHRFSGF